MWLSDLFFPWPSWMKREPKPKKQTFGEGLVVAAKEAQAMARGSL